MELIPGLDRIDMRGRRPPEALDAALRRLALGEIRVKMKVENYGDIILKDFLKGKRRKVRRVLLKAVADTGAVYSLIPEDAAEVLGLKPNDTQTVVLGNDQKVSLPVASGVRITVAGRTMTADVLIGPPGCIALVGQLVMEALDLIADPRRRTLTVRPESPLRPTLGLRAALRRVPAEERLDGRGAGDRRGLDSRRPGPQPFPVSA